MGVEVRQEGKGREEEREGERGREGMGERKRGNGREEEREFDRERTGYQVLSGRQRIYLSLSIYIIRIEVYWQVRKFVERAREKELLLKRVNLILYIYIYIYYTLSIYYI
jgi:hypothetical protein